MAESYLEFSEVLTHLSAEEAQWLQDQLEVVHIIDGTEYTEENLPHNRDGAWIGCRAYRDMEDYDPDFGEDAGFAFALHQDDGESGGCCRGCHWGRHLWIYSQDHACLDRVAHLVQKFLRTFRPGDCRSLTYSVTCSKPRVGEFGGGALFVTASDVKWFDTWRLVEDQLEEFNRRKGIAELIDKANRLGLQPEDLDDAVHDAADSLAAAINNAGLDEQVSWLADQLVLGDTEACIAAIAEEKAREGLDHDARGER